MADKAYSPDWLEDWTRRFGGPQGLMGAVLSARHGEQGADPALTALTPEERAALDRYANFAIMAEQGSGPVENAANYLGGMVNMTATEALKGIPGGNRAASSLYNLLSGTPDAPAFFGGKDVSGASLASLLAAHRGFMRKGAK